MTWESQPAAESRRPQRPETGGESSPAQHKVKIGRRVVEVEQDGKHAEAEVFTMTLEGETILLLPLRNWGQLDVYKWRVRGKLPGTPAGLEITPDHVKITGESVLTKDPDGCAKLEKLVNDWLALEQANLDLARRKAHGAPVPSTASASASPEELALKFQVEVDKRGQVHVRCLQGKEVVAQIGLNVPGFSSLVSQGFMRKPRALSAGALHDWVELDGEFFSFEKGNDASAKLQRFLNEKYLPLASFGAGKKVVVSTNAASPTGFDIQFPVSVGGAVDSRRRPLNEEALDLLQDPTRCGLLHKPLVIKLAPPNLIFKMKTADGGERYLDPGPGNTVRVVDDDGVETSIDLTHPVNYLRRSAVELTAVFNHPSINPHGKLSSESVERKSAPQPVTASAIPAPAAVDKPLAAAQPPPATPPPTAPVIEKPTVVAVLPAAEAVQVKTATLPPDSASEKQPPDGAGAGAAEPERPLPNFWLEPLLQAEPISHDWFSCLVYRRIAEWFGNSCEGKFGPSGCWCVALGEVEDIADPLFKGIFLTAKEWLGFMNQGRLARFHNGVVFLGTPESAIEGIEISLLAVGLDAQRRAVFIVSEGWISRFGIPEDTVRREVERLRQLGAVIMSPAEVLKSPEPIEVLWTAPAELATTEEPQALETVRATEPLVTR